MMTAKTKIVMIIYPHIISSVKPKIVLVAQKIYDLWIQDENDELNGGGICHLIADKIADILNDIGIPSVTVSSNYVILDGNHWRNKSCESL